MRAGRWTAGACGALALLLCATMFACLSVKWYEPASKSTDDELAAVKVAQYNKNKNRTDAYGVMIDCGSSGSRVFVFTWKTAYVKDQLLNIRELSAQNKRPGLSSFEGESTQAIEAYLRPLVDFAASVVPAALHADTPFFVLCTAGMRKLTLREQERILNVVRSFIKSNYKFDIEDYYVEVISGKQEAVYSWITANYLLDQFKPLSAMATNDSRLCDDNSFVCLNDDGDYAALTGNTHCSGNSTLSAGARKRQMDWERRRCRLRSFGMVEMGGASMQIAFEMSPVAVNTFRDAGVLPPDTMENNYTVDLNLGCTEDSVMKYFVYVTTYLNYGAMSAHDRYYLSYFKQTQKQVVSTDPCLPKGYVLNKTFTAADFLPYSAPIYGLSIDVNFNKTISLTGTGNYDECLRRVNETVMNIRCSACNASAHKTRNHCAMTDNCTIMGYWQPAITFNRQPFYAFSDFYYRYTDLYGLTGAYNETLFRQNNAAYCSKAFNQLNKDYNKTIIAWTTDVNKGKSFAQAQLESQCFQAAYDYSVLHYAFKFPLEFKNLYPAGEIRGSRLQWTLGAMLYKTRHLPTRYKTAALKSPSRGHKLSESTLACVALLLIGVLRTSLLASAERM